MCVFFMDSGESYIICECLEECLLDFELVCSFYYREFNNWCEMYRYVCVYDLIMKVMNWGKCLIESKWSRCYLIY